MPGGVSVSVQVPFGGVLGPAVSGALLVAPPRMVGVDENENCF